MFARIKILLCHCAAEMSACVGNGENERTACFRSKAVQEPRLCKKISEKRTASFLPPAFLSRKEQSPLVQEKSKICAATPHHPPAFGACQAVVRIGRCALNRTLLDIKTRKNATQGTPSSLHCYQFPGIFFNLNPKFGQKNRKKLRFCVLLYWVGLFCSGVSCTTTPFV